MYKSKHYRNIFTLLMALSSTMSWAQNARTNTQPVSEPSAVLDQYIDSLRASRHSLDSIMSRNDSIREADGFIAENQYYRIFAPTTYYGDIVGNRFRLGRGGNSVSDDALLHLYLNRPDLLRYTSSQLAAQENMAASTPAATPERIEMTKQVSQTATPAAPVTTDINDTPMNIYVEKPHFWTFKGDYYLQFMQTALSSNWYKSGSNTYSMLGQVTLQYNYNNKQKTKWDNKLEMKLGFQANEADTVNKFKSSEDLIRYTSKLGIQAHKNWYYTLQLVANTQFTRGLKNNNTAVFSDFMSPFNLNVSVGMDYTVATNNKKLTGSIHLAPLAFNFKYCDRKNLAPSFGINNGHRTLEDFGSTYTVELVWKPIDMLKWQTRLYGYTTYHKYEMEWENTFTFTFNKYISAVLFLYPRFDDSAQRHENHSYFQYKEYLSFGFTYSM